MNPRLTKKELNLIKGEIRRIFARSELRQEIVKASVCTPPAETQCKRPRVTRWSTCSGCQKCIPTYLLEIDHINPVVPVSSSLEELSIETFINNLWCEVKNLAPLCNSCHDKKTRAENKIRHEYRRARNGNRSKPKGNKKTIKKYSA